MAYEFEVYKEMCKTLPKLGEKVNTADGKGRVLDLNILKRTALVDLGEGKIIRMDFPKKEPAVTTNET